MYSESSKRRSSAGHDLAYRMWSTKGARFFADERYRKTAKLSTFSIAFLSVEVIALNLAEISGVLDQLIGKKELANDNMIAVITLILSILILVFSIFENAKDYTMKASKFHTCGLEINKIYNKLKMNLASHNDADYNNHEVLSKINEEYEEILARYENHERIDYLMFLNDRKDYFKIKKVNVFFNSLAIYFGSKLLYHILILVGPVILCLYPLL